MPITEEVLKNTFTVNDLSPLNLSIDDVDYTIVGEYTTNIYATDSRGNIANKEIKVIVKEPTINIEQANISLTVGETNTHNATVQGASQTVTWTSSDTSIASVDENGVVTTVKEGTATVEAEANGTKTSVTVAVMRKNSSYNGSTSSNSSSSSSSESSTSTSTGTHKHTMPTGNIGKWFDSQSDVKNYWNEVNEKYEQQYRDGVITYEEYMKKAPYGYETWSCSTCGKWTGNFKYR